MAKLATVAPTPLILFCGKRVVRYLYFRSHSKEVGLHGYSHHGVDTCFRRFEMLKVTMNKLCARLFIIIFIDVYRKSEYIPTVTNFASILANGFYFLRKITALRPSVLNF